MAVWVCPEWKTNFSNPDVPMPSEGVGFAAMCREKKGTNMGGKVQGRNLPGIPKDGRK